MDFFFDMLRVEKATKAKPKPKPKSSSMPRSTGTSGSASNSAPASPRSQSAPPSNLRPDLPPRKPIGEKFKETARAAGESLKRAKRKAADGSKRACAPIAASAKSVFRVGTRKLGGDDPNSKARRAWTWTLGRQLRIWRVIHALACLTAGVSRVNAPAAVYLFLFTAQCALAPAGGLYQGTARKENLDRTQQLHAWFQQRRLLWLTVTASSACLGAQLALHIALGATGTSLVYAETGVWRAVGIHRFQDGDDLAAAIVPDLILLIVSAFILAVVRTTCARAMTNRFKHAVTQVITMQRRLRRAGEAWRVDAGFDGNSLTEAALASLQIARRESSKDQSSNEGAGPGTNVDHRVQPADERYEPYVEVIPATRTSSRAAALWRAVGSVAAAAAGAWHPSLLNCAVFLVAVRFFLFFVWAIRLTGPFVLFNSYRWRTLLRTPRIDGSRSLLTRWAACVPCAGGWRPRRSSRT